VTIGWTELQHPLDCLVAPATVAIWSQTCVRAESARRPVHEIGAPSTPEETAVKMSAPDGRNRTVPPTPHRNRGRVCALAMTTAFALGFGALIAAPASANTAGTGVVINEAALSGGSAGAAFKNKFVELYNP